MCLSITNFTEEKNAEKNFSSLIFFRAQTKIKWHQFFCSSAEVLNIFPNGTGETLAISIFGDKRVRALILNFGKLNVKFSEKRARNQTRCHSYNMNLVSWDFLFIPHFGYCKIIWNIWSTLRCMTAMWYDYTQSICVGIVLDVFGMVLYGGALLRRQLS